MTRAHWAPWLGLVLRLVLAGVLGVAGALKISDPAASVAAVRAYQLLPEATLNVVGYGLPFLEIALALLLVIGLATRYAAFGAGLLMVAFIVGISSAWARGLSIDCGCFGGGGAVAPGSANYLPELIRDGALGLVAAYLVWRPRTALSVDVGVIGRDRDDDNATLDVDDDLAGDDLMGDDLTGDDLLGDSFTGDDSVGTRSPAP